MQSTLTPTETDPHDIFVIEPDVVLAARADQTPAAPAVEPISPPAPPQAEKAPDVAAPVSMPKVDTAFRATASAAAPAAGEIRVPEIGVPSDIHLSGRRPPRGRRIARGILGFVFAIGTAAAAAAWSHYGNTAKTMIANWTPFVLTSPPSQAVAKQAVAEQPSPLDTQGSAQASATDQAPATDQPPAPSVPAAQPTQDTAPAAAAAPPPPQATAQDIAAMSQQIDALKASIEQLKAGQEQLSQQMAQQVAKANAAKKLSALAPQPVPAPARKPRPAFSPAMAAAALSSSRAPAPATPPQAAYRPPPQPAPAPPPQYQPPQYQPRAQVVDQPDVDADAVVRPPMPVR
jgi:hypothetical protein